MATQQIAQGLAGLGRHGDSTLVHMQPEEVAGLQALAKTQGTTLTINPETGLPEAFNLGGFFRSLAPTLAGLGVAMIPGMQPFGLSAMQAGILAGAATGAVTNKKDPLMGAAMGGLGGYGGASLAGAAMSPAAAASVKAGGYDPSLVLKNSATAPSGWAATEQTFPTALGSAQNAGNFGFQAGYTPVQGLDAAPLAPNFSTAGRTGMVGAGDVNTADILANNSLNATSGMGGMQGATPAATTFSDNLNKAYTNVAANPMGFVTDNAFKIGAPLAMATLEGMRPELMPMGQNPNDRYDPDRSLNLNTVTGLQFEPYLNNYAQGGPVSFAEGGAMQGGGSGAMQGGNLNLNTQNGLAIIQPQGGGAVRNDSNLPPMVRSISGGRAVTPSTPRMVLGSMGGGSENRESVLPPMARLSLYAQGGPVSFADGGEALRGGGEQAMEGSGLLPLDVSDINAKYGYNNDPSAAQPWGGSGLWGSYNTWGARSSMPNIAPPQLGLFADNDQIEAARTAYEAQLAAAMAGRGGMGSVPNARQVSGLSSFSGVPQQSGMGLTSYTKDIGSMGSTAPTAPTAETALTRLNLNKTYANGGTIQSGGIQDLYGSRDDNMTGPALSRNGYGLGRLQAMADGGMAYAAGGELKEGGFVIPADVVSHLGNGSTDAGLDVLAKKLGARPIKGKGDGMSDSIPTTIEGRQPARVADGEAYVPPEVVARFGGANRFYNMLDKVRKTRTGTKKQGKQIKPEKYMPA